MSSSSSNLPLPRPRPTPLTGESSTQGYSCTIMGDVHIAPTANRPKANNFICFSNRIYY